MAPGQQLQNWIEKQKIKLECLTKLTRPSTPTYKPKIKIKTRHNIEFCCTIFVLFLCNFSMKGRKHSLIARDATENARQFEMLLRLIYNKNICDRELKCIFWSLKTCLNKKTIFIIASVLVFRVVLLLFAFLAQVIKIPYYLYKNYNKTKEDQILCNP